MDLDYSSYSNRLTSFDELRWPPESPVFIKELVEAGFVYTGIDDVVFCFKCGISVSNWKEDDDALTRHAQLSKDCPFLRKRALSLSGDDDIFVDDEETFLYVKGRGVIRKSLINENVVENGQHDSSNFLHVNDAENTNRSYEDEDANWKESFENGNVTNSSEFDIGIERLKLSDEYANTLPSPNVVTANAYTPEVTTAVGFPPNPLPNRSDDPNRNAPTFHINGYFRGYSEAYPSQLLPGNSPNLQRSQSCPTDVENVNSNLISKQRSFDLSNYSVRLKTFLTFPKDANVQPVELAEAGFYYVNRLDLVKCFMCNVLLGEWKRGDTALDEHCKFSPNCEFVKFKLERNHPPSPDVQHIYYGIQPETSDPRLIPRYTHPRQAEFHYQNPDSLGYQCYGVNNGMQNSGLYRPQRSQQLNNIRQGIPHNDPYIHQGVPNRESRRGITNEHSQDSVNGLYFNGPQVPHYPIGNNVPFQESSSYMGYPDQYIRHVRTSASYPTHNLPENNHPIQEGCDSIPCPTAMTHRNVDANYCQPIIPGSSRNSQILADTSTFLNNGKGMLLNHNNHGGTFNASSNFYRSEAALFSNNDLERHHIPISGNISSPENTDKQIDFVPSLSGGDVINTRRSTTYSEVDYAGNLNRKLSKDGNIPHESADNIVDPDLCDNDDLRNCKICMDAAVEITFVPCGHLVVCSACSKGLTMCPICRKDVTNSQRTYFYGN